MNGVGVSLGTCPECGCVHQVGLDGAMLAHPRNVRVQPFTGSHYEQKPCLGGGRQPLGMALRFGGRWVP